MLRDCFVSQIFNLDLSNPTDLNHRRLSKEDTYVVIFGPDQENCLTFLKKEYPKWIVYEAPKAVNMSPDHGEKPRNTLVLLEVPDDFS